MHVAEEIRSKRVTDSRLLNRLSRYNDFPPTDTSFSAEGGL